MSARISILAAAAVLLAGCGGSGDPLHAVRSAATSTLALTAQSTLTLTGSRLFGTSPPLLVRGEFAFPKGLGYAALQIPAHPGHAAGTAYFVYLPARLWIKPVSSAALPAGDLWLTARFAGARSTVSTPSLVVVSEVRNPQLLLDEIATGAVAARSSGHPVVDHVPYTEYVVSVDVARALGAAKAGALRVAMQQQLAALRAASGSSRVRVVARVDGAGRLAQLRCACAGSQLGTLQIELWKFGRAVPLSLPLASETADAASVPAVTVGGLLAG